MSSPHILVVDDEPDIRTLIQEILEEEGYEVSVADSGAAARRQRRTHRPDLILLDVWMEDIDGISLLREWAEGGELPCPVIIISGHGTVETAVEATRLGAYDFIEKPISLARLLLVVERALEADALAREVVDLKQQLPVVPEPVGRSDSLQRLREQVLKVAAHDTGVLLKGEPGSGKKTFAYFLHHNSPRRQAPLVEVSVGSLSQNNSAVELFGSEDDERVHYGRFEQANRGTLYIDDIADMDEQTQARLLSALETRSFTRVGGTEPVRLDVRIVAATRHDLDQAVALGRLREDLYYHLNVVPIQLPRLAEHCEDVPELLNYYVAFFVDREHLPYRHFSLAAQNRLRNYSWPGNVRELKNLVQRLLILGSGEEITLDEVESALQAQLINRDTALEDSSLFELPLREAREQFEKNYLEHQLQEAGGSVGKLAGRVGMERTHLYRTLKALGIDVKKGSD